MIFIKKPEIHTGKTSHLQQMMSLIEHVCMKKGTNRCIFIAMHRTEANVDQTSQYNMKYTEPDQVHSGG